MQLDIWFRLFGVLLCSISIVKGNPYAVQVNNLFERHFNNSENPCWKETRANKSTNDKGMVEALVHVYTQQCKNYNSKINDLPFFNVLNKKLREGTNEQIWLETEKLLNQALKILGLHTWSTLYRACECKNITQGHTFTVNDFWSTSLLPEVANSFLGPDKIFFQILQAPCGAAVSNYSAYKSENEILLQSKREFYVTEYVKDEPRKKVKKSGVKGVLTWKEMKAFAVVTGNIPDRSSRSASKSGYCDCSRSMISDAIIRSDATMPTTLFRNVFVIAMGSVWLMETL